MSKPPSTSPRGRRRLLLISGGAIVLGVVVLALLALPLRSVPGDAEAAKADLDQALSALRDGDVAAAGESVDSARSNVDAARAATHGIGGDVWSALPFIGTPVSDARHLVQALDDATSVAEIGVDLYPSLVGKRATLLRNEKLDLAVLDSVTSAVREAGGHLLSAEESLGQVEGNTPLVGDTIATNRDAAASQVAPMAETYRNLEPMLDELPTVFGADGKQTYLVAMLNPAELRYSGGATLAFAPLTWENGVLDLGDSSTTPSFGETDWRRVRGNTFHYPSTSTLRNATFAPSWSDSGEELLRAWRSATGKKYDGVLAVDVVALSRLFGVTGAVTVPGYGELTEDNLVETLVGSYDDYYPDPSVQDELNSALIPAFKDQLFDGGDYADKAKVLAEAADGRHLALYFRDRAVQAGFASLGFAGDIAKPTTGDYLGVFSQNINASKVDVHQRRKVSLDVRLAADGSASNRLNVVVDNDTPPYAVPVPDARTGYFTRWSGLALTSFLSDGARLQKATSQGRPWDGYVGRYRSHDFLLQKMLLEPGSRARFTASYRVPTAAEVAENGDLTYRLAVDPQAMVIPESIELKVHLPDGYQPTSLPEGWTADGDVLTFSNDALDSSQEWEIVAATGK